MILSAHSVEITEMYSTLTFYWQKFRESNGFTKDLTKKNFSECNFFLFSTFKSATFSRKKPTIEFQYKKNLVKTKREK